MLGYVGNIYGEWVVLADLGTKYIGNYNSKPLYQRYLTVKCKCGNIRNLRASNVILGKSKRCSSCAISVKNMTHNLSRHPLYRTWIDIKRRCYNPKNTSYKWYGAKGVTVCKRWLKSFPNFLKDMGEKPTPSHSIDRINPNGNYTKKNCRWATLEIQNNNKRKRVKNGRQSLCR